MNNMKNKVKDEGRPDMQSIRHKEHRWAPARTIVAALLISLAGAVLAPGPVEAQTSISRDEGRRILRRVDELVTYPEEDFSAEYTLTQERPGQGTSVTKMTLFRRDRADTYTILIMEPAADRGKGYLKIGENLWLYDPVDARFTVTSSRDRFQNSNARNSDFTRSNLAEEYMIVGHTRERLGAYETDVYDLEAIVDSVTFPIMRIWIDQDDLVRKFEDYSLSGQHMRTTAIPTYRRLGDRYVPVRIVIQDELRGRRIDGQFRKERTLIAVDRPSLRELPNLIFTRSYLERFSD
jgi:outer membrane lipoprotein-sorting protein